LDKIDNVDLREALDSIARNNTFFHLYNDLGVSIEQMEHAAKLSDSTDKTLIWVSYPSGIDCYPEREVFQKGTRGYHGVLYHGKEDVQGDRKLAYAVDVHSIKGGKLLGSLYEIDIREYAKTVRSNAVPSNTIRIYEENGRQSTMPKDEFDRRYPLYLVKMADWRHEPDNPAVLKAVIDDVWNNIRGGKYKLCDIWQHTSKLYDDRDNFYSNQILRDLSKLSEPNSADKQFFTTSLDARVAAAFDPEQLSRLLDRLPYKGAELSIKKGQSYMQVIIPRDEIQLSRIKQNDKPAVIKDGKAIPVTVPSNEKQGSPEKPSILKALKQGAEKARQHDIPDKALTKSKGVEL